MFFLYQFPIYSFPVLLAACGVP